MLLIVMHNNQKYLDRLTRLAVQEDIKDVTIIQQKDVGLRVIGGAAGIIFSKGKMFDAYDKAFVALVKGKEKLEHFLNVIEQDSRLEVLNLENRGFICAIPFHYVTSLKFEAPVEQKKTKEIEIANFLRDDRIVLNMKSSNKEGAIKELADPLRNADEMLDFDLFLKDVFMREELSTTGIGHHVAIPHARTDAVKDFVVVFGRSQEGIPFDSFDKKPAKFIVLMGTPKTKGLNSYIRLLAQVTRLFKKKDFQNSLLKVASAKEALEVYKRLAKK